MPAKRNSSSGAGSRALSRGKAKAAAKAAAKAVEKAAEPALDPAADLEREATGVFERYQPEGDLQGVIKLSQFADCIRDTNIKKNRIWGDEPQPIVKQEWTKVNGFQKRELTLADFKAWWPTFQDTVRQRCEELEAELLAKAAEEASKALAKEARCSGDGVWTVPLRELPFAMEKARQKEKTPLVIDNTEHFRAEAYFVYTDAHIIECKKMLVDKATKKMSVAEILEEERQRFFRGKCFRLGRTVLFRLGNSAADLKGMWNSDAFPTTAFLDASEVSKVIGNGENFATSPFAAMCPDKDTHLELTAAGAHENFQVAVVTQFTEEDYEEFLATQVPLHLLQPIRVTVD